MGKNMGQTVEKPENIKKTVSRLLGYFKNTKKLLIPLVFAVVLVTLTSLFAPMLQGQAIDEIKNMKWQSLYRCIILLAVVYVFNIGFTLAQSLFSARLSQLIVKLMRYDLFKKIDRLSIKYTPTAIS